MPTEQARNRFGRAGGLAFWKIVGSGAAFQAGSSAVDSATVVASLVLHLTGSVYAVGAASAVLRLGWLLPQIVVGYWAQRMRWRMPFYVIGAFGRAACIALIAALLALAGGEPAGRWVAVAFLGLWTLYAFVSGIVAVPYNDIVGRSIPSGSRSRLLAWRFFGGGVLAVGVAAVAHHLLSSAPIMTAYALVFALAALLMFVSSISFVAAGEPATPPKPPAVSGGFGNFLKAGVAALRDDVRFRMFLHIQWLSGATLMTLPFYVVLAFALGLGPMDVGLLLGAQTVGSLASNPVWGCIGDRRGKLALMRCVGVLRLGAPLGALGIAAVSGTFDASAVLIAFVLLFVLVGALINGMTIGYLGYLMEISPDDKRSAYSGWFNAFAAPAALLPLVGAAIADGLALEAMFGMAIIAAVLQLFLLSKLAHVPTPVAATDGDAVA